MYLPPATDRNASQPPTLSPVLARPWWLFHVAIFVVTVLCLLISFLEFHRRRKRLYEAKLHRLSKNRKFVTIWNAKLRSLLAQESPPSPVLFRGGPTPSATYHVDQRSSRIFVVTVELRKRAHTVLRRSFNRFRSIRSRLRSETSTERTTNPLEMTPFCSAAATGEVSSHEGSEDVFFLN